VKGITLRDFTFAYDEMKHVFANINHVTTMQQLRFVKMTNFGDPSLD